MCSVLLHPECIIVTECVGIIYLKALDLVGKENES